MNTPGNEDEKPEIMVGPYRIVRHMRNVKQGENPKIFIEFDQPVNPQEIVIPKLIKQMYPFEPGAYLFETQFDGNRCTIECKPLQKIDKTYNPNKKSLPNTRISETLKKIIGKRGWGNRNTPEGEMKVRREKIGNIETISVLFKRLPSQTNVFLRFNEEGQLLSANEAVVGRIRNIDPSDAIAYILNLIDAMDEGIKVHRGN